MSLPKPDSVAPKDAKPIDILNEIKAEIRVLKPQGWHRKSVSPYYRLKFALEIKQVVDEMVATGEDRIYYYEKFSKQPYKFSPNTLYSYVYQALRFLKTETIEGIDRDYYLPIIDKIATTRDPGVGVRLSFHADIPAAYVDIAPDKVIKKSEHDELKHKITDWLEKANVGQKLVIGDLGLTEDEVETYTIMLMSLGDTVAYDIDTKAIKIRKIN